MREILFRGKSIETGKWIEPNFNSGKGACYVNEAYDSLGGMDYRYGFVDIDPKTIGQYTGLKDKKGVKIFEGDIVKHIRDIVYPTDYRGEPTGADVTITRVGKCSITASQGVVFTGNITRVDYHLDKAIDTNIYWRGKLSCMSEYGEVIGNIHDNPELLEGI